MKKKYKRMETVPGEIEALKAEVERLKAAMPKCLNCLGPLPSTDVFCKKCKDNH